MATSNSDLAGTTWNVTSQWDGVKQPDYFKMTLNADNTVLVTPTDQSFNVDKRVQVTTSGVWRVDGSTLKMGVSLAFTAPADYPVIGSMGVYRTDTHTQPTALSGSVLGGVLLRTGPEMFPDGGKWNAVPSAR